MSNIKGKPRLLDLFCGAGGAGMGYAKAGFEITGVDIFPQPNNPHAFVHGDALDFLEKHGNQFDAIHASPPCQPYSVLSHLSNGKHEALVPQIRELLTQIGKPWIIENVPGSPLVDPVVLCGTMFGLGTCCGAKLRRHRLFETSFELKAPGKCNHQRGGRTIGIFGDKARDTAMEKRHYSKPKATRGKPPKILFTLSDARQAMGADWMSMKELSQAIPPAYTEYIGLQLHKVIAKTAIT